MVWLEAVTWYSDINAKDESRLDIVGLDKTSCSVSVPVINESWNEQACRDCSYVKFYRRMRRDE